MTTRMSTLAASATLAVFVATAFSADGGSQLGSDRDNASSSLSQASLTTSSKANSGGTRIRIAPRGELTGVANSRRAAAENDLHSDRDNTGHDLPWALTFPTTNSQGIFIDLASRPVLSDSMPESNRREAADAQFGTDGGYLLLAGEFASSSRPNEPFGHCGTDDYSFDTKGPSLESPRILVELPLSISLRSAKPTFISASRPSAAVELMQAETMPAGKPSSGLVGTIYAGSKGRHVLGTFRMAEGEYEFVSAGRVPTDEVIDGPIFLGLGGEEGLGFAGEIKLDDIFQITDADGKKAGDVRVHDDDEEADLGPFGDLTGDGLVNQGDFVALMNAWGTSEGDLNHDGTTDGVDLGLLLEHLNSCWG
ncbi:MAG: hypothetical protein MK085_00390 [Phycisphaerales bacterium]|nr:hypothetical protein [Phycisphaerales bacterium]